MFALLLNGKQLDPATFINVGYVTLRPCYANFAPITVMHAQACVAYESVLPLMVGRITLRPCYANFAPIMVMHAQAYVAYESVLPLMVGRIWMSYLVQH
ncbi:hypothetical protein KG487_002078 [Salmonella enterica subsp. enterica serovar 4,5,12:b:-]|nr:hypothetical protein [Salmonella enterica subsp. enterica]ECJ0732547.1 hypothetical protein [Salmonella enterica]EHF1447842.1 hypothetical protein [Salmonella enterica subsp. enterica serovar 4,5,12:b:-]EHG1527450.1 hypothetical protein [Salmonella enterica subsp. enterica serovar 4,[5],12:b:-]ECW3508355.1 hypothetical protein [Salmonella enterica]